MSGVLQRIRPPREAQTWARKLNLQSWLDRKDWNPEPKFKACTRVRELWTISGHVELGDDPEYIVRGLCVYLGEDKAFLSYVLDELQLDMTADGEWEAAIYAYAWFVLQRYNRDLGGE